MTLYICSCNKIFHTVSSETEGTDVGKEVGNRVGFAVGVGVGLLVRLNPLRRGEYVGADEG